MPQRNPCTHHTVSCTSRRPVTDNQWSTFCLETGLFWPYHINQTIKYVAFCVFHLAVFSRCTQAVTRISASVPLYGSVIFHCTDWPRFVHSFRSWWTAELYSRFGDYEQSYCEHFYASFCLNIWLLFLSSSFVFWLLIKTNIKINVSPETSTGGPVAKTSCSQCRGPGSIPCQGTRSHMPHP